MSRAPTRRSRFSRLVVSGTALSATLYLLAIACGSSRPDATDGAGGPRGSVLTGACATEGETAACHLETGRDGNLVNCFHGTQVCHDGVWGPCGGGSGTVSTMNISEVASISALDTALGSVRPMGVSASAPSPDAGGCGSNPCNPNCVGLDVDADTLAPDGGLTTVQTVQGSSVPYESFSGPKAQAQDTTPGYCSRNLPATSFKECNYDYCCGSADGGGANGTCIGWTKVPEAGVCNKCAARDFTTGIGCKDTSGIVHVPVCNRGTVAANTGKLVILEWSANPSTVGTSGICALPSSGSQSSACVIDLATKPIPPNECIEVRPGSPGPGVTCSDPGAWGSGNRVSIVNPPSAALPASLVAAYGGSTYTQAAECDTCNNQSFVNSQPGQCASYGAQPPPPADYKFTYTAECGPGFRPRWNQFAYSSTVPNSSQVQFSARTADPATPTAFSTSVALANVQNPGTSDPAICPMNGPAPCPKNLALLLGTAATGAILELSIRLTSTTNIPSVQGWQLTYSCVAKE